MTTKEDIQKAIAEGRPGVHSLLAQVEDDEGIDSFARISIINIAGAILMCGFMVALILGRKALDGLKSISK